MSFGLETIIKRLPGYVYWIDASHSLLGANALWMKILQQKNDEIQFGEHCLSYLSGHPQSYYLSKHFSQNKAALKNEYT